MNTKVSGTRVGLTSLVTSLVSLLAIVSGCVTGDGPAPILGLILDRDYKVVGLVPDGAAEKAGVQEGDEIKQVNGQEITGGNSAVRIFRRLDLSKHVMLVLARDSEELDVELIPLPPPQTQARPGAPLPTATPMPPDLLYY